MKKSGQKYPLLKEQAFINGVWVGQGVIPVINPATGEEIAKVPDLDAQAARQAVAVAHKAFAGWSKMLPKERAAIIKRWHTLIVANADILAEILTAEQGKPLLEARAEVLAGATYVEFFAEEIKRSYGELLPPFRADARGMLFRQPLGVVAAITPWNFPSSMITRKISAALATGCTVVCKPAENTPLSALALAALAEQAGFPAGVLNILTTYDPAPVGEVLATDPLVRGITFTGSTEVGRLLMRLASGTVKRVLLELGGNAAFIVFDDADLDVAVAAAIAAKFRNSGQACVAANRFLVQDGIYEAFAKKMVEEVRKLVLGDGAQPGVTQGPLIDSDAVAKVQAHIAEAVSKGAKIAIGGKPHALGRTFFEPTVLTEATPDMLLMCEETFGPLAPLARFQTEQQAIDLANSTPYGLAAYFFTRDAARQWRMAEALESGIIAVNTASFASETATFGGMKQSGLGREGSHHGIDEYTELKYVLMAGI